jgi:hypothetical protein
MGMPKFGVFWQLLSKQSEAGAGFFGAAMIGARRDFGSSRHHT